jgi:hypothetical protein
MEPFRPALFERSIVPEAPGLGEVIGAQLGYSYAPTIDSIYNDLRYGPRDYSYDPKADAGEYLGIAPDLVLRARNEAHMAAIKRSINGMNEDRQILAQATLFQGGVAGILDPINLVALPFGGPTVGIGRSALRIGAGVGAIQAGLEAAALPLDPYRTYQESALNIATASLFGAGFGAALGAPLTARAKAWTNTRNQLLAQFDQIRRIDEVANLSRDDIAGMQPRDQRPLGALSDEEIRVTVARIEADAENLQRSAEPAAGGMDIKDRADEILAEATPYRRELGFRALELEKIDIKDPYNIAPSWFTNSMLFKFVTTPLKRQLQGKIPSSVKEKFVKTASDAGMALNLNLLGLATPQAVYQRAAVAQGRWVAAHYEFLKLWSADTNAPLATVLDINIGDLARQASRAPDTYGQWLKQVSEKRIQKDTNLTENERKAVEIMDRYFKDAERRLEDVGLIGTSKGIQNQIIRLEEEIAGLTNELAALQTVTTSRGIREREMVKGRLGMLQKRLEERQEEASAMYEFDINPEREDAWFSRFWNNPAIKANRQEFADILFKWYQENPTVMRFDPEQGRFVRVELETSERAIRERVDQTIANILGEKDPTNVDNIGFGYGRSKHFRHRQVDIPNKLVMKFIITDPLAVMKAYASRIEPRYEYARMFGKDVDGVIFDIRREMIRAGKTEAEIAETVRDYNHLYDRIAGTTTRDPSALNQRVATVIKTAAELNFLGSAGFAALPDFGRIVMEYELQNVVKGVQTILDKQNLKRTVREIKLSGEALDILRGTAFLRLVEGMVNDINANDLLTKARNAFYILNGLAPLTTIFKYIAGTVDGHTIIEYSIKLTRGELDDQSRVWLARYGIDEDLARKIANSPWELTDKGLYMANTEEWTNISLDKVIESVRSSYREPTIKYSEMSEESLLAKFGKEFYVSRIITDPVIVQRAGRDQGYGDVLGLSVPFDGKPSSVFIDFGRIAKFYNKIKSNPKNKQQSKDAFDKARAEGRLSDEEYYHRINILDNVDLIENVDQFSEFILLHELYHTTTPKRANQSNAEYESAIDQLAFGYMRNKRETGIMLEAKRKHADLVADAEKTVEAFRIALNSGVMNTIISGTPADKPIISDGVMYIPTRIGKPFGFKEDPRNPGYVRIENAFLALPLHLYTFALATVNKTVGALAQGQVKNRAIGVATMLGLAYMTMQMRTPDYIWDKMSWQDKFARTYDMSGVTALYSDLFYTAMHTSLALGGPNITGGLLSPKFPQQPSMADAINGFAGAGPSWATDMALGIYQFAGGDYGEGAREIVRNLPFARMWFWKDEMNQLTRAWAQ